MLQNNEKQLKRTKNVASKGVSKALAIAITVAISIAIAIGNIFSCFKILIVALKHLLLFENNFCCFKTTFYN